ncbi:MAG: CHAP domain-containing protein [Tannerella sp.]|nr:CHAP domain-containing protein [Tannerella sp.]
MLILIIVAVLSVVKIISKQNINSSYEIGQPIDSLNGVIVFYNGGVDHVSGRNLSEDGYNLGLKYQCVEFVKRYYYEYLNHKMPDSYGHAKSFFNEVYKDGELNKERNLIQYMNPSMEKPMVSDLVIFDGTLKNRYGHVAIVSGVTDNEVEIIQQNPGAFGKSRETFILLKEDGVWRIGNKRIMGWLRKGDL